MWEQTAFGDAGSRHRGGATPAVSAFGFPVNVVISLHRIARRVLRLPPLCTHRFGFTHFHQQVTHVSQMSASTNARIIPAAVMIPKQQKQT